MDALLWILLPVLVAAGTAMLCFSIMKSRMEVAVAKERESLAAARSQIQAHEQSLSDKIRAAEEAAQRKAFDQFLMDFRVEERHYMRETKSHFLTRKSMVMQERLYFRNIPLSNWVEHEMPLQEGSDLAALGAGASVFSARSLPGSGQNVVASYLTQ